MFSHLVIICYFVSASILLIKKQTNQLVMAYCVLGIEPTEVHARLVHKPKGDTKTSKQMDKKTQTILSIMKEGNRVEAGQEVL